MWLNANNVDTDTWKVNLKIGYTNWNETMQHSIQCNPFKIKTLEYASKPKWITQNGQGSDCNPEIKCERKQAIENYN